MFDFGTAKKIPVFIFGPVELSKLSGRIQIVGIIRRGMIHFGSSDENVIASREPTRIYISGNLIFNGECKFAKATQILVWDDATLDIGANSWVGSFTKIVAFEWISIGENFMASWECQIFDTDFHFLINKTKNHVENNTKPVAIGKRVWIGSRVSILKGTKLPDETVVAASSLCNGNYEELGIESIIIGGVPAKLLSKNFSYVTDKHLEKKLFAFYRHKENKSIPFGLENK